MAQLVKRYTRNRSVASLSLNIDESLFSVLEEDY